MLLRGVTIAYFLLASSLLAAGQYRLTIKIELLPDNHKNEQLFVAGNFNGWNPVLTKIVDNNFTQDGLKSGIYEFKITRGGWDKVEVSAQGADIANRFVKLVSDTVIYINILGWKDDFAQTVKQRTASKNVIVPDTAFNIPQLSRTRNIRIYLPPDYSISTKRYPVVYMHDGQNLFDEYTAGYGEWGVDETMDSFFTKKRLSCIVIGIDNGPKRLNEYNPYYTSRFGDGEGDYYTDFIVKTLKPYIDKNYRTKTGKSFTAIAGSSMGGLISMYAALKYPNIFGASGVFSPSFWIAPKMADYVKKRGRLMKSKVFFYAGGQESEEMVGDVKKIVWLLSKQHSNTIKFLINENGRHNEAAWKKYFPYFIQFWLMSK